MKRVIRMKAVRVDSDGNELGGVPVVLRDAPLGTYLGWNIVVGRILQGADLQLRRRHDPVRDDQSRAHGQRRPAPVAGGALHEHEGYVEAVKRAAAKAVGQGFLLQPDADALVAQAAASNVLRQMTAAAGR